LVDRGDQINKGRAENPFEVSIILSDRQAHHFQNQNPPRLEYNYIFGPPSRVLHTPTDTDTDILVPHLPLTPPLHLSLQLQKRLTLSYTSQLRGCRSELPIDKEGFLS